MGTSRSASLWPTKATNVPGTPASSGWAAPSAVSVTGTALTGSAYVSSMTPPRYRPRVLMP